jgi:hypothetical protein
MLARPSWARQLTSHLPAQEPFRSERKQHHNPGVGTKTKKVEQTTLSFKHEFYVDRLAYGKAYLAREGTPIRVSGSLERIETEFLGWTARRIAKMLAAKSGWLFEDV